MSLKRSIKHAIERASGLRVTRAPARGTDIFFDLKTFLPRTTISTIFDVGANVGQSAEGYLQEYPRAQIHCFEPVGDTFRVLSEKLRGTTAAAHQIAFAASAGTGTMSTDGPSTMRRLGACGADIEEVAVSTIDQFCRQQAIENIDFLKIDTEGHDLEVLKGGAGLLRPARIGIVEVEAGMSPRNERHVPFEDLKSFLESFNYVLFGVYDQVGEWVAKEPHLRRANLLFISPEVIRRNARI